MRQDAVQKVIARLEMGVPARGEDIYDSEVIGSPVKKSRRSTTNVPVLKLTQVGEMNILRRSRERS